MNTNVEELVQRWNVFLQKIETRFNESLHHAKEACFEQLEATDYDYNTTFRSWVSTKAQINDLIDKIDTTWEKQLKYKVASVAPIDIVVTMDAKGTNIREDLLDKLYDFEKDLEGELSITCYEKLKATIQKEFKCTQCNSPLTLRNDVFRVHYVSCTYCQATNTFTPETKYTQLGWNIIDNIAYLKTKNAYTTMKQALQQIQDQRPPVASHFWDTYKEKYLAYYQVYFKERIALNGDLKERFNDDMERKIKEYETYESAHKKII